MTMADIPTVEELVETTGQSREQLEKDRDAITADSDGNTDE
jgi:hypothetical protein